MKLWIQGSYSYEKELFSKALFIIPGWSYPLLRFLSPTLYWHLPSLCPQQRPCSWTPKLYIQLPTRHLQVDDLKISQIQPVQNALTCTFCSIPVQLNCLTILPISQAISLGHPWLFPPLNLWLLPTPSLLSWLSIWILSHTKGASFSLSGRFPQCSFSHSSIIDLLNHSRLKSFIEGVLSLTSTWVDLRDTQYFHDMYHTDCYTHHRRALFTALFSAFSTTPDAINICRIIVAIDWELCAKCLAK